jgi:hypothetical protein
MVKMHPQLPPPDPHESLGLTPDVEVGLGQPTVVFAAGPPSPEVDRVADAILGCRPGMLVVFARD